MTKQITGALLIDKPPGPTSHDIVAQVRRALNQRRIGHTGTLDPFASGLLIILVGSATRLAEYTHHLPKTYHTTAILGATSTTDDADGKITPVTPDPYRPNRGEVQTALKHLAATTTQTPPAYAARKVQGKRLYDIARQQGSTTARQLATQQSRPVTIHQLQLQSYNYPKITFSVTCSTGTYVRALVRDLGHLLHTKAYTKTLRRTDIGSWTVQNAIATEALKTDPHILATHLQPSGDLVTHLPSLTLAPDNVAQLQQGRKLQLNNKIDNMDSMNHDQTIAVYDQSHRLIGIAAYDPTTSLLSPRKILS